MSAFEKVIGYNGIKKELLQVCDMIKNREAYEKLGAGPVKGILLYGAPGMGKSLTARCFVEESGLRAFIIRKTRSDSDFVDEVTDVFKRARDCAPCIILLDDMDKFANEDENHQDAEEYVAIQSGIDEVKERDVYVIATANDISKLPGSLIRAGRFDKKIEFDVPTNKDAERLVQYYLSTKKVLGTVNLDDVAKMLTKTSCAAMESILNEGALIAAAKRKEHIEMDDIKEAVLKKQYNCIEYDSDIDIEEKKRIALHEAGHLVCSEILKKGSVGLASVNSKDGSDMGGFIHRCEDFDNIEDHILVALAGKVAVELYYAESFAKGCRSDLKKAITLIQDGIRFNGTHGVGLLDNYEYANSGSYMLKTETLIANELERYMLKTREILLKNKNFLERIWEQLVEKDVLLHSEIQETYKQMVMYCAKSKCL